MSICYITKDAIFKVESGKENIIILSPTLYWFKRSPIVIKSFKKANTLANSILKDRPKNYDEIKIIKQANDYYFFAYDKKLISDIISKTNLKNPKIYFAQNVFETIEKNIKLDEDKTILVTNNIVVQISTPIDNSPSNSISFKTFIDNYRFKKGYFFISAQQSISNKKQSLITSLYMTLFIVLLAGFAIDLYSNYQEKSAINRSIQSIDFDGKSKYIVKSLIKKWEKKENLKNLRNDALLSAQKSGKKTSILKFEDK